MSGVCLGCRNINRIHDTSLVFFVPFFKIATTSLTWQTLVLILLGVVLQADENLKSNSFKDRTLETKCRKQIKNAFLCGIVCSVHVPEKNRLQRRQANCLTSVSASTRGWFFPIKSSYWLLLNKCTDPVLSITFEVDVLTGKVGGSWRHEFPRGVWGHAPPQKILKFRCLEMLFSTFSRQYLGKNNQNYAT